MKLKFVLVTLLSSFLLMACNPIKGYLTLNERIKIKSDRGKKMELSPGKYRTKLTFMSKKRLRLDFKKDGKRARIDIKIPKNRIPKKNGSFDISAKDMKQKWGLRGEVRTTQTESEMRRGIEHCTYYEQRYRCRHGRRGRTSCRMERYPRTGRRSVEYYNIYTHQELDFEVTRPEEANGDIIALGAYEGDRDTKRRVYTYTGRCF